MILSAKLCCRHCKGMWKLRLPKVPLDLLGLACQVGRSRPKIAMTAMIPTILSLKQTLKVTSSLHRVKRFTDRLLV